ncbi:hypothetical protein MTO96_032919 [Rhipicephalus appendiculatus]
MFNDPNAQCQILLPDEVEILIQASFGDHDQEVKNVASRSRFQKERSWFELLWLVVDLDFGAHRQVLQSRNTKRRRSLQTSRVHKYPPQYRASFDRRCLMFEELPCNCATLAP